MNRWKTVLGISFVALAMLLASIAPGGKTYAADTSRTTLWSMHQDLPSMVDANGIKQYLIAYDTATKSSTYGDLELVRALVSGQGKFKAPSTTQLITDHPLPPSLAKELGNIQPFSNANDPPGCNPSASYHYTASISHFPAYFLSQTQWWYADGCQDRITSYNASPGTQGECTGITTTQQKDTVAPNHAWDELDFKVDVCHTQTREEFIHFDIYASGYFVFWKSS